MWLPLRLLVCENCWLVQAEDYAASEVLFSPDYAYFSSFSSSWLEHSERYSRAMISRFHVNTDLSYARLRPTMAIFFNIFKEKKSHATALNRPQAQLKLPERKILKSCRPFSAKA